MTRATLRASLVLFAILAGCGSTAEEPANEATSGSETEVARGPSGPPPSFLPAGTKVIARLDMARVRRSPLALDIASAIRSTTTWQRLAGSSGVDPVQDFDAILVGGDAVYSDRRVVVLRHPHTEADVRQRLLAMAVDRGSQPAWRDVGGFAAIAWPMERTTVPYSLVITAPHELVLAPDDDLERIASVARDHALRRPEGSEEALEPQLTSMREGEIATMLVGVPLPAREGYPTPPQRTNVLVDEGPDGRAVIAIDAQFASEAEASAAQTWLDQQRAYYASQMMVRAIGMHRPLEEATVAVQGTQLALGTHLTTEELRRMLGLMALSQVAQVAP
ncbi:hypothetical protein [Sandaracinus amylolyticus]|uniref:hypothetical protein n=1 Tax=Sandaracinus amylolyticus TaxID=927083 RepID=UPI001F25A5B5|nr:hypothetical protein [Sandaracinus amylolyticus]UJR79991.1 Hypothetical protein I5071_20340 [Sandaracinus amylolyticus]